VYDDALIRPWFESAVECVPGLSLFDAHAHIGFNDPDGLGLSARELIETMEAIHARSVVTPLHEPDGYSIANDRVLEECERSAGRLVPFCRVDPHFTPMLIATCVIRTALQAGADADRLRAIAGGQLERLLEGKDPLDLGPPVRASRVGPSILLERVNAMLLLGVSRMLLGDTGYEPLGLARLACDIGVDDAPEMQVCRSVLALLELQERSARQGEGFAAPGAGLLMLAANVTRTPDVPLPPIPELATEADIRSASLVGHRLLDASDATPRAAEIRRLSTIFPTVDMTAAASTGDNGAERSEVRGSSLPDHMIVDHLGPSSHALGAKDRRD
jgi:hypothetical protein